MKRFMAREYAQYAWLIIVAAIMLLLSGCASYLKGFDTSVSVANIVTVDVTVGGWKSASTDEDYTDMEASVVTQEDEETTTEETTTENTATEAEETAKIDGAVELFGMR